jgi:hypothetical protein
VPTDCDPDPHAVPKLELTAEPSDPRFDLGSLELGDERPENGLAEDRRGAKLVAGAIAGAGVTLVLLVAAVRSGSADEGPPSHPTAGSDLEVGTGLAEGPGPSEASPGDHANASAVPIESAAGEDVVPAAVVAVESAEPASEPPEASVPPEHDPSAQASPRIASTVSDPAKEPSREQVGASTRPFADLPSIDEASADVPDPDGSKPPDVPETPNVPDPNVPEPDVPETPVASEAPGGPQREVEPVTSSADGASDEPADDSPGERTEGPDAVTAFAPADVAPATDEPQA